MVKSNAIVTFSLFLLLLLTLSLTSFQPAKAQYQGHITINADGNIEPYIETIRQSGNVYILTANIAGSIILDRNNTVFDGAGYSVQGISGINYNYANITVMNAVVNEGGLDIRGTNILISNNTIIGGGIRCGYGSMVSANRVVNSNLTYGIAIGSKCTVIDNYIVGSKGAAILISMSSDNVIVRNQIERNTIGIDTLNIVSQGGAHDNIVYYNNFVSNSESVRNGALNILPVPEVGIWDNGTTGNYWSDYNGTDANGDGIGDTPYIIDANNIDRYPLMSQADTIVPTPTTTPTSTVPEFSWLMILPICLS